MSPSPDTIIAAGVAVSGGVDPCDLGASNASLNASSSCDDGFILDSISGMCYKDTFTYIDFQSANGECQDTYGLSSLLAFNSQKEVDGFMALMKSGKLNFL